jgi:hypothetical protein
MSTIRLCKHKITRMSAYFVDSPYPDGGTTVYDQDGKILGSYSFAWATPQKKAEIQTFLADYVFVREVDRLPFSVEQQQPRIRFLPGFYA